jgi:hypothetical protein
LLQNVELGVILGKEIRIFLYIGAINYPCISSVSSTSFIRGMILYFFGGERGFKIRLLVLNGEAKKNENLYQRPPYVFKPSFLGHGKFYFVKGLISHFVSVPRVFSTFFGTNHVQIRSWNNPVQVWTVLFGTSMLESAMSSAILNTDF